MSTLFEGQHVLITGGLGDIGRAIAQRFLSDGARVSISDLPDENAAREAWPEIGKGSLSYTAVNVTDEAGSRAWVQQSTKRWGTPTVVIPNAAGVTVKPTHELTGEEWRKELDINLNGSFYLAQEAVRVWLKAKTKGSVIFIGSWAAHRPHPNMSPYAVSKAGLRMLCKNMALEYAPLGIRFNEVAPGWVDAGLTGKLFKKEPAKRDAAIERAPMHQLISADEVAWHVWTLAHPENKNTTGSTLLMDGGLSLLSR